MLYCYISSIVYTKLRIYTAVLRMHDTLILKHIQSLRYTILIASVCEKRMICTRIITFLMCICVLLGLQTTWLSSSIYWYNKKKHFLSLLLDKIIYFMIHLCHIHKPNKFPVWSNVLGKRFWNKLKEKVRRFKHQTVLKVFLTFLLHNIC